MATGINDLGQVVGVSNYLTKSWLYDGNTSTRAEWSESLVGEFNDINNNGQILTFYNQHAGYVSTASPLGSVVDLGGLTSGTSTGLRINNSGQVIGYGSHAGSSGQVGFLMTPIPEPGTLVLLDLGVAGLSALERRSRGGRPHWTTPRSAGAKLSVCAWTPGASPAVRAPA